MEGRGRLLGLGPARWAGLALALAVGAALFVPTPAPEALHARGLDRLLREDTARARAGEPRQGPEPLVVALARAAPPAAVALEIRVDGEPARDPALERVVRAVLRPFRDRPPAGLPPLPELAPPGAAATVLEIHLRTEGAQLFVESELRGPARRTPLARIGPWRAPGRASLLPPLVAIGAALLWQHVLGALFLGILVGAVTLAFQGGAGVWAPLVGLADIFRVYFWSELVDDFRIEILGFILALLAMVGVMSRAGGVQGLVDRALFLARSARSGLVLTWAAGLVVFFDDYANCMLVGGTLRPLTDRLRISREKLAYVVDSTAAPVAGVSLLSTWIAFQVSVYAPQLPAVGIDASGYALFVEALPYRFYCWLTLFFVLAVAVSGRDFGPMARAEARARRGDGVVRPGARPPFSDALARMEPAPGFVPAAHRAVVPLLVTFVVVLLGLSGPGSALLGGSNAAASFAGTLGGLACAVFLAGSAPIRWAVAGGAAGLAAGAALGAEVFGVRGALLFAAGALGAGGAARGLGARRRRPHLPLPEVLRAATASGPTLLFAVMLLFEAWMIGAVCADLATADYLVALLAAALPAALFPVLLFVVGALVAFATGSSWSTMSILLPNAIPLAAALGAETDLGTRGMVVLAIGAVLDGAIFGDHCSPLSDTTVLSSVASGSDHMDHVRTQAPYAAAVAIAAVGAGYLPLLLGPRWGAGPALAAGALGLVLLLAVAGRAVPGPAPGAPCSS